MFYARSMVEGDCLGQRLLAVFGGDGSSLPIHEDGLKEETWHTQVRIR